MGVTLPAVNGRNFRSTDEADGFLCDWALPHDVVADVLLVRLGEEHDADERRGRRTDLSSDVVGDRGDLLQGDL
eukprot:16442561-Heterocapsa_arctica.AAC.1